MGEKSSVQQAVLSANAAFYRVFATRDFKAMDALWARNAPVACIHPGWETLNGRDQVMESWHAILGNPAQLEVRCLRPSVHQIGPVAFVTCYESIAQELLAATNIFVLEKGDWRMVHHQAGPAAPPGSKDASKASGTIH